MLDALSAELLKLMRLRATWLLAWIYPILVVVFCVLTLGYGLIWGGPAAVPIANGAAWIEKTAGFLTIPNSTFGRYLIATFAVFCTANEYAWNTWKMLVPVRARWQLILAKVGAVTGLLLLAFIAADLLYLLSAFVSASLLNLPIPADVTAGAIVSAHWTKLVWALPLVLYTVALGVCLSVITRSALGAIIMAVALISIEGLLPLAAGIAAGYAPTLVRWVLDVLPFYHLLNIQNWAQAGQPTPLLLAASGTFTAGLTASIAIWALWTAGLVAAAVTLFRRQDIH